MLKFYSFLIGEDYDHVRNYQPASRKKIALLANCMCVPIILWFINGFMLVSQVMKLSIVNALITAFVVAFIVFLIERAVIMASGNKWITSFRITLGIVVAMLGSISLDEVVFRSDIDQQVSQLKEAEINKAANTTNVLHLQELNKQEQLVALKASQWNQALKEANNEADGTGGSGVANVGKIALLKMEIAAKKETEYKNENDKLTSLKTLIEQEKLKAQSTADNNFASSALLIRIKAMALLISKDSTMLFVYILFSVFLFMLEFLVVIIKMFSKNSIDEELEIAREIMIRNRTQKILDRSEKHYNPEAIIASLQNANSTLQIKSRAVLS